MGVSFSQRVKNEILHNLVLPPCCTQAFLATVISCCDLIISDKGVGFSLVSTNLDFVKFTANCSKKICGTEPDIICEKSGGKETYTLDVHNEQLLRDVGALRFDSDGLTQIAIEVSSYLLEQDCCKKTYVKALFLACGSVVIPEIKRHDREDKSQVGYRLEFTLRTEEGANQALKLLAEYGVSSKCIERKSNYTLYVQDGEGVSDMLILLGASNSLFEVEDLKIARSLRNTANRQTNCEVANIEKSTEASRKQIAAITKLIREGEMNRLEDKLKEVANARLDNPDASIGELAQKLGISKSGVMHRLNKIMELAEEKQ